MFHLGNFEEKLVSYLAALVGLENCMEILVLVTF